jgi:hypothetical protein
LERDIILSRNLQKLMIEIQIKVVID